MDDACVAHSWCEVRLPRRHFGILWIEGEPVNVERSSRENPRERCNGFFNLRVRNIQVCDSAIALSADRVDEHTLLFECGDQVTRRASLVEDVKDHDIRFHMLRSDLDGWNLLKQPGQFLRMFVVGLETGYMSFQRIDAGGGQHAGLTHGASVHATKATRSLDELGIVGQEQGSDGRAEPLREADGDGFKMLGIGARRERRGGHGIEEPSAVQMHRDAVSYRDRANFFDR